MKIVVLTGGVSSERNMSLYSAYNICSSLRRLGHEANILDLFFGIDSERVDGFFKEDNNLEKEIKLLKNRTAEVNDEVIRRQEGKLGIFGENVIDICRKADLVFMSVNGKVGEDGHIQAVFDLLDVKYTGSSQMSCLLSLDKYLTKKVLVPEGILMPKGFMLKKGHKAEYVPYPCVVKPCSTGSSIGVSLVNNDEELTRAIQDAFSFDNRIIVEEYIEGREFSVGILDGKALPVMEIRPKDGFNNYKSKWDPDMESEKICPANLDKDTARKMQRLVEKACDILDMDIYAKADLIMSDEGEIYLLEINSLPNMLDTSVYPNMTAADDIYYDQLIDIIIKKARYYIGHNNGQN
ncbi:D-alanine--D-alanine ligase family protein [Lachnospira sp.]|jgi:D-alanine-D-alanine ligase|uniref:D-alanine--D-alanine ligase family protein n=1 Tax=Lachnospira sp. TaxID=2049031 RepID=UPI00257D6E69|nr:D-alanine--D-alanine ligase [Lachnospira sp.]